MAKKRAMHAKIIQKERQRQQLKQEGNQAEPGDRADDELPSEDERPGPSGRAKAAAIKAMTLGKTKQLDFCG